MVAVASPQRCETLDTIDYGFLLLAHTICADQQIHIQEARALRDLATQAHINPATLQEMEKILGQDESRINLEVASQRVPVEQRSEVLMQVLAIAYVDGYFSPPERELVNQLAQFWGIHQHEIEQMLEGAQGFGRQQRGADDSDDEDDGLSIGAWLLKGAESVLSRSLVSKLADLTPDPIEQRIERLQREILLSGPGYDEAIQQCAKIAGEDYKYAKQSLHFTYTALKTLGHDLQQSIHSIKQKTAGQGQRQTAKEVAVQLEQTRQKLLAEVLHELESVRESLRAKQRALNSFTIAFMGRTKAGKSTLHAVITREGWDAIGVGKQRTTRYNRVYEWRNIRIIDTPGIGAPGGKTDEEVARSVIEEADV
ncbi:MAG: GTPase, partial [Leptolyngbyaceae bacterium]|nr:GTPase [Leptolyngbyaceae bacterium]